ncbi:type II toxin-antitoxin system VapC family toxin [Candidatus Sumerlaeota bacterium]|nr:type II toxin-antitoxin system VapC family toxin [Candidatus Sumerlaeota bacterium]MBI3736232.1 type II toxin-antitoxin system VapC family toxin [Candidatus Sumerlaeota bacterium]
METVYIETTVISYLVANPSRDIETAGQQQTTRHWWLTRRPQFQCVTSAEMIAEASQGDPDQAAKRLATVAELAVLPVTKEMANLAAEFLRTGALPAAARSDAIHLAAAACAQIDYLLTWNCRHLANAQILRRIEREAARAGWTLPTVCTPMELMGEIDENESNT